MLVGNMWRARGALAPIVIIGLVTALLVINAGVAMAKPGSGNSGNAKACANWESLYRSDGTTFANRDECVSYGAMGGMILTSPPAPPLPNLVVVNPPSAAAGTYEAAGAEFGPAPSGQSGSLVLVNDGSAAPSRGCGPIVGFPAGSIAIVDAGDCSFVDKVLNAQNAGAIAVIIVNDVPGDPTTLEGSSQFVSIPSVMVSLIDGATIKVGLPASGSVSPKP